MIDIDNVDVAVFTRVNDLAQRHGLKPYDFIASFQPAKDGKGHVLQFEVPPQDKAGQQRFDKMLLDIGVSEDGMRGEYKDIIDALDNALERAPVRRSYRRTS